MRSGFYFKHSSSVIISLRSLCCRLCVCCVCFLPIYYGRRACGRTSQGHTGGRSRRISQPPSFCGACLIFLARRIQPFLSLVDRDVEFCVVTNQSFSTCWAFFFFCEKKSQLPGFATHVPTSEGFAVTN